MVAEHNTTDPFEFADPHAQLLEALAEMNLDPAEPLAVEAQILLCSRLKLTKQELKERHAELQASMATAAARPLPGGGKRFAARGARGIPAQIDKPGAFRFRPEAAHVRTTTPEPPIEYPEDLYPDSESLRARVYQVIRENGVDLRHPVANRTTQAIACAAGARAETLRGTFDRIRMDLGISPRKGRGVETPINLDGVAAPSPAETPLTAQVEQIISERGIDLQYLPPDGFVAEMMERFGRSEDSIRSVLKAIRKRRGIRSTGRPVPGSKPRQTCGSAVTPERDPVTGHFLRADGTNTATVKQDARALALELVAELRTVDGEKRGSALVEAARLLGKLL